MKHNVNSLWKELYRSLFAYVYYINKPQMTENILQNNHVHKSTSEEVEVKNAALLLDSMVFLELRIEGQKEHQLAHT